MYATALNSTGERSDALRLLRDNERRRPADQDTLNAVVDLRHKHGNRRGARLYATGLPSCCRGTLR